MQKEGLFFENGELLFYKDGNPHHAGIVQVDGAVYYIGSHGRAVKGVHVVHRSMANDLVKHGTYTFGEDYKLIPESYIPPKKSKKTRKLFEKKKKHRSSHSRRHSRKGSKKKQKLWLCVAALVVIVAVFYAVSSHVDNTHIIADDQSVNATNTAKNIILPTFDDEVLLCSASAKALYKYEISIKAAASEEPYRALKFSYVLQSGTGRLEISENADMSNARSFDMPTGNKTLTIDNLKTGTNYFYKVTEGGREHLGMFKTAASTRFVYMPGVWNTRDIGGYKNMNGRTVRQGLLIRGTEMDGLVEPDYFIKADAVADVQNTFGFRYDMDLRAQVYTGAYQSPLGKDVGHKFYNAPQYGQIFTPAYQTALREIFTDLADPDNYPMYLHCTYGTDRTGTIVYLLQGVLNMPLEDMSREYTLTGLWNSNVRTDDNLAPIIYGLESYAGNTLQQKIVTFLTTDCGITQAQIESIRDIFLK